MNRVKRTSRLYEAAKPDIGKLRERNRRGRLINKMKHRKGPNWSPEGPTDVPETENLMDYTVKDLRKMAKVAGLKGVSKLKKDELVRRLS